MRRSGSGSTFSEWNISLFQWRSLRSLLSNRIASARSQSPNMYSALFAIALFIAAWPIDGIDAKAEFNIIGTKAVCSKESELVHNVTCGLKTVNRTASLWSMDVYFGDGVVLDSIYVKMSWFYKTFNDAKFKPFLGLSNVTTDLCAYLDHGNSMLVDMFIDEIKKTSNLFHACPFSGHCYVKDFIPNTKRWPSIIPNGEYYMWFLFYTKKSNVDDILLNVKFYAEVKTIR